MLIVEPEGPSARKKRPVQQRMTERIHGASRARAGLPRNAGSSSLGPRRGRERATALSCGERRIGILERIGIPEENAHLVVARAFVKRLVERVLPSAREAEVVRDREIERRLVLDHHPIFGVVTGG